METTFNIQDNANTLLTRNEVADFLGISLVTLHNHNKKGILKPTHKIGRKPLYQLSVVMKTIQLSTQNSYQ